VQTRLYIGGQFVDGLAGGTIEVINPADGTVLAAVAEARAEDIDRAVAAAAGHTHPRQPVSCRLPCGRDRVTFRRAARPGGHRAARHDRDRYGR
jgi:hypothetical protein